MTKALYGAEMLLVELEFWFEFRIGTDHSRKVSSEMDVRRDKDLISFCVDW